VRILRRTDVLIGSTPPLPASAGSGLE